AGKGPLVLNMSRDWLGRVQSVSGVITQSTLRTGTAASHAARSWCCNSGGIYDAGHLIANVFGGRGGLRSGNIIAMLRDLNQGAFKTLELNILRTVEAGNRVSVHVQPVYSGGSTIPVKVAYWWRVNNGWWQVRYFQN
ncbi:MAG: DNA/RNA non-specific endonuclease, partial [Burkholderiales bacterium]